MDFEIKAFLPKQDKIIKKLGLDANGRIQQVIDSSFIHYMRLKMPEDTGMMISQVKNPKGGLVTVETPYAHYMNEGILYVNPEHNSPGFPIYEDGVLVGYKGYKGKRVPSGKPLNYHGGPDRGAHFVERTASENFKDIVKEAQEVLDRT